ncbi:PLP-dependent aminotransferase family protein [Telmatospirillum sp.]|uniref:MocR-like pyridoxine biosynthesis transcription factor PdxR n=1 Tax=Telmatospirillum sp. TaxID=2079197 RepID=UPI0028438BD7|nr:PLP-dependent aminotransferase family protein [Telmatospirillum sp.]MDR3440480.1 PLP-dependent aminotransferase family protein [Telmatospirillum sp.]
MQIDLQIDRQARPSLTEQICTAVRAAIADGRLLPGARLPSWRDLAAQLGVARGTVRLAYDRLADEQLIASAGAAGTYVAAARHAIHPTVPAVPAEQPSSLPGSPVGPAIFQLGVPALDVFPTKTWSRILVRAGRAAAARPVGYPDARGEATLRRELAASLALSRCISCVPAQIFVTTGYAGALGVALRVLQGDGTQCWMEEPGYPLARHALGLAGIHPVPVPVDSEGLDVAAGIAAAPTATLALVTAGQQAPLGYTLSLRRRLALFEWATRNNAWIIEDDYLGELQLKGRAAPALSSQDPAGRVLHIGTFSKTINPALRLGFLVVPQALVARVAELVGALAPAPAPLLQHAVAEFLRDGHFLRHLRHMKRVYAERRDLLCRYLTDAQIDHSVAGLAVLQPLPCGADDIGIARMARDAGLSPVPLSPWYGRPENAPAGLLLGVTNLPEDRVAECCRRLTDVIKRAQDGTRRRTVDTGSITLAP